MLYQQDPTLGGSGCETNNCAGELDKHPSDGMEVVKYIAFGMGCDGVCISGSCKVIRNNLTVF